MLEVPASNRADPKTCPIRNVLDHVGDKWSLLVLLCLEARPRRFMEVQRDIGDITRRVLTQTLRKLERDGYVARRVYPTSPPAVEYRLTPLGQSLLQQMHRLITWARDHYEAVLASRRHHDAAVRAATPPAALPPAPAEAHPDRGQTL